MSTKYKVTSPSGELLGIFAKGDMATLRAFVAANPDARVKPIVTADHPCLKHTAYEADNCPACGTSALTRRYSEGTVIGR